MRLQEGPSGVTGLPVELGLVLARLGLDRAEVSLFWLAWSMKSERPPVA